MRRTMAGCVFLVAAVVPAPAQTTPDAFVAELRRVVAAADRAALASLIRFPITVWAGSIRLPVPDAASLASQYDAIFTADMQLIVAQGPVQVTPGRVAIGGEAIEAEQVEGAYRITRISVLVAPRDLAASPPAPGAAAARPPPRAAAPMRLTLRAGQRSVQWADTIGAGETDSFILFIARGQLIEVRLDRVRARDAVVRVLDHKISKPLDARAAEGVRVWTGRVPAAADYRIEVSRTVAPTEPAIQYMLTVTFK